MSNQDPYRSPHRRSSPDRGDRRRHRRVPLAADAEARADGFAFPARLVELSPVGASAEVEWRYLRAPGALGAPPLGVGSRLRIDVPRLQVRDAEAVVRRIEPEAEAPGVVLGLEFERLERSTAYRLLAHRILAGPFKPS
jgi:hypothetical protein